MKTVVCAIIPALIFIFAPGAKTHLSKTKEARNFSATCFCKISKDQLSGKISATVAGEVLRFSSGLHFYSKLLNSLVTLVIITQEAAVKLFVTNS